MQTYKAARRRDFRQNRSHGDTSREAYLHGTRRALDNQIPRISAANVIYQEAGLMRRPELSTMSAESREEIIVMKALVAQAKSRRRRRAYLLEKNKDYITEALIAGASIGLLLGFIRSPLYYMIFFVFGILAIQHLTYQHKLRS